MGPLRLSKGVAFTHTVMLVIVWNILAQQEVHMHKDTMTVYHSIEHGIQVSSLVKYSLSSVVLCLSS